MFDLHENPNGRSMRLLAISLALLGLISLVVTILITLDVRREQEIVAGIVRHLPQSDLEAAQELSGSLRLNARLAVLMVLNVVGTTVALVLVLRGYLHSERSLRDVKVLATDIIASMDAAVITTDRHGMMTSVNAGARDRIGIDSDSVGKYLTDIDRTHATLAQVCSEVNATHETIRDRDYCVVRHGHKHTHRVSCTILRNQQKDEIGTVVYVRDVTEKALLEERLRRMERYMGLGSLAAGLQHEIKNPLSALMLHIQLLQERLSHDLPQPDVTEMLDVLQTEVTRISKVLDGFRNYATVNDVGRSPVLIRNLVEKLVRLLRPQADSHSIVIDVNLPSKPVGTVLADEAQLEQVLLNLALNGIDAMPDGGTLTFTVSRQDAFVRIDVADTGIGIPPEIQSQIFDPYFTTRPEGTGMGLALCYKYIRQHGGTIDFRTGEDRGGLPGTEFTVLLPLEESA
ncbi:MAG: PAS domain S-box protein [Planctomycetaceae bacterium]|nr:PAS domain S-box protein [Planctomycetaceae bacterium]